VENGKVYPGANYIEKNTIEGKSRFKVKGTEKLEIGQTLFRHPLPGERCIFCR
jgi:hypothetical protein